MGKLLKAIGFGALACIVLALGIFTCGALIMLLKCMGLSDTAVIFVTLFVPVFIVATVIEYKYW